MVQSLCCLLSLELHDEGQNTYKYHGQDLSGRHIFYSHQILMVAGLELVFGLKALVTLLLLASQILGS